MSEKGKSFPSEKLQSIDKLASRVAQGSVLAFIIGIGFSIFLMNPTEDIPEEIVDAGKPELIQNDESAGIKNGIHLGSGLIVDKKL